jgi:hypothetical protein
MATFLTVDPAKFISLDKQTPEHGRGAWTRAGIGDDYRYHVRKKTQIQVGNEAEKSLDHWAVSAGVDAIQARLTALGHLTKRDAAHRGNYGGDTKVAVAEFQAVQGWSPLGVAGHDTSKALFTPLIDAAETKYEIPDHFLRGMIYHESSLDPGALGWYIFYQRDDVLVFGGVDRALAQINSKQHEDISWLDAFAPDKSVPYAGKRLRVTFDGFSDDYPKRPAAMVWDAAICSHNSPARARDWLSDGGPSPEAAKYVGFVKGARY